MNFSPFGVPLSAALSVATQFTTASGKLAQGVATPNGQVVGVLQGGENGVHYIRPLDAGAFGGGGGGQNQAAQIITLPITMPGAKPGDPQQTVQIQVVNPSQATSTPVSAATQASSCGVAHSPPKYQISQIPLQAFGQGATVLTVAYNSGQEGIQILEGQNGMSEGMTVVAALQPQDIQLIQAEPEKGDKEPVALIKTEGGKEQEQEPTSITIPAHYLQTTSNLQDYLHKIQHQTLPSSLQQFLKFNTTTATNEIKREAGVMEGEMEALEGGLIVQEVVGGVTEGVEGEAVGEGAEAEGTGRTKKKKKYKKKPPKPKKPKPGQVHIATAVDGTTLFCCPECHMAYPEKDLLEQHLAGHKIERRFICDICGAGLKRKEHLERHKLGHNPERPFVCSVCLKGFKRKEHLNLHYVIHSGEKTEICGECGKGFYRKDHLRKHARSHVTRRAKEQAEQAERAQGLLKEAAPAHGASTAQVTISVGGVPNSQIQIPVQIQVPPHHLQVSTNRDEETDGDVSTVVLPSSDGISIMPN